VSPGVFPECSRSLPESPGVLPGRHSGQLKSTRVRPECLPGCSRSLPGCSRGGTRVSLNPLGWDRSAPGELPGSSRGGRGDSGSTRVSLNPLGWDRSAPGEQFGRLREYSGRHSGQLNFTRVRPECSRSAPGVLMGISRIFYIRRKSFRVFLLFYNCFKEIQVSKKFGSSWNSCKRVETPENFFA